MSGKRQTGELSSTMSNYDPELSRVLKILMVVAAAAFLFLALWLTFNPGVQATVEFDQAGRAAKTVETPRDYNELVLLLVAGAFFSLIWSANGLRFTTFKAGPLEGSAQPPELVAAREWQEEPEAGLAVTVPAADVEADEVEPRAKKKGSIELYGEREAVYSLEAIPTKVIRDLLSQWPTREELPSDLSAFEFATRKTGKGNHPWTVKFEGHPAIRIAYGGQAKKAPTVGAADT